MKSQFPVWLTGSPEQQQAEQERQALAIASHTRAKLSESERLIGRGQLYEQTARVNLEQAKGRDKEARILAQNQLADALAMQGRFAEAAEVHTDKDRRKYFRGVVKAIETPDDEKCNCSDDKIKDGEIKLAITPRFERAQVFSPLHNDLVSLVECSKCSHVNARLLRSRLLPQKAAVNKNEQLARTNLERKAFDHDALVLRANT